MATKTFNAGVYDSSATLTVNSSLSLSGANNSQNNEPSVVLDLPTGDITTLKTFGLLYNDPGQDGYGDALSAVTLSHPNGDDDTTIRTALTGANTEYAIIDANGFTITYNYAEWGDTTLTAVASSASTTPVNAVGPEHRRKYLLGY